MPIESIPIEWDNPEVCAALFERVGLAEYNRLFTEHRHQRSIIVTVNGHAIRALRSIHLVQLYEVGGTGRAFSTLWQAENYARYETKQPG